MFLVLPLDIDTPDTQIGTLLIQTKHFVKMMNFGTKTCIVLVSFVFFHVTEGFQKPERQQVGFHKPEDTEMPPFFKEHNPEPRMPFPDIAFETEEPVSV